MNMKKMAIQFGERIGDDVPANQIKVKGGWLFHKLPDYPDEVDCYALPLDYSAEPWDGIDVKDSPFVPRNADRVAIAIEKLTKGYDQYMKEIS